MEGRLAFWSEGVVAGLGAFLNVDFDVAAEGLGKVGAMVPDMGKRVVGGGVLEGSGVVVLDGEGDDTVGLDGGVDAGVVESVHVIYFF